ncbi:MAG: isochorismatase family protein [Candidatus Aenigmarchaeota archaeon]|nr:isochorismatase family protein [Candidatus Aenigmarchaeota archaeon]
MDYTQSNGLPLVVISPRSDGFDEYLPEVRNHKDFKVAKLICKDNFNAFTNPEVDEHLKGIGVKQLVLGGYNFFGCVSAAAESAYKIGYSLYTAKTILYVSPVTDAARSEKEVVEGYFKKVYENVDALAHGLGLH